MFYSEKNGSPILNNQGLGEWAGGTTMTVDKPIHQHMHVRAWNVS